MAVIYRYARYFVRKEEQEDSLHKAMRRAWSDCETNRAHCYEIEDENGRVYDSDAMIAYWIKHNW